MSNFNNEDSREDSRMSFVTVSSMIDQSRGVNESLLTSNKINITPNNQGKNTNNNKSLINSSLNNESKENFEDLPLQYSNNENKKKVVIIPYLIVEEKGDKKDYIGTYKNYEISLINEKGDRRILCYRRYDNFDIFYNKLKKKYPFLLIPKLIGKNPLMKIMNIDMEVFNKRRRQLNYFLNYLLNHDFLKESRDFMKFVNDPEFDEEYFKKEEPNMYDFPESLKNADSISNKIYGVFSNFSSYFKNKDEDITPSEQEIVIKKMEGHYKKLMENFRENKNHLKSSENYSELSNNFFYLKDVNFDSQNTKEYFNSYHEICSELVKINKAHFEETGVALEDRFEGFLSILTGLCDTFDRYNEFLKSYIMVQKASADSKINTRNYDLSKIAQEVASATGIKGAFEKGIMDETKSFINKYTNEYAIILENYKNLIKSINAMEASELEKFTKYYSK